MCETFLTLPAKVIVSGDSHLLKLKAYKGIEIITVAEFVRRYS